MKNVQSEFDHDNPYQNNSPYVTTWVNMYMYFDFILTEPRPTKPTCGPVCDIFCPFGNVPDENGCPTCRCSEYYDISMIKKKPIRQLFHMNLQYVMANRVIVSIDVNCYC